MQTTSLRVRMKTSISRLIEAGNSADSANDKLRATAKVTRLGLDFTYACRWSAKVGR